MTLDDLKWETVELLQPEPMRWEGQGARHAALEHAEKQSALYDRIVQTASSVKRNGSVDAIAHAMRQTINGNIKQMFSVDQAREGYSFVSSPFPVLSDVELANWHSKITSERSRLSEFEQFNLAMFIISAVACELLASGTVDFRVDLSGNAPLLTSMFEYTALRLQKRITTENRHPIEQALEGMRKEAVVAFQEVNNQRTVFKEIEDDYRNDLFQLQKSIELAKKEQSRLNAALTDDEAKFSKSLEELAAESRNSFESFRGTAEARIADHEASLEKRLELKQVTQRWQHVKARSFWTLIGSGATIVVLIAGAILAVVCYASAVLEFIVPFKLKTIVLQSTVSGAIGMQIGRVAVVAIPVISYFWLVKIVVRIFLRSLVLMDDADQRATIMESYYTLTSDGMSDERALPMMLWAIFRPLPGHGPDGIEPPDFTEAINAGLKGKILDTK
ncbi:DUF6161 domain-containing protein [Agrobacterium fabrum]|uniref:DUF6161 domain-containing protein n=1 Tax=Agrobacterium fabrum TaxID=1176649 RepID=UPI003BA15EE9